MDLSDVSQKHINELEQATTQFLKTLRNAKLQDMPLYTSLQGFEQNLGKERRERFDKSTPNYKGY